MKEIARVARLMSLLGVSSAFTSLKMNGNGSQLVMDADEPRELIITVDFFESLAASMANLSSAVQSLEARVSNLEQSVAGSSLNNPITSCQQGAYLRKLPQIQLRVVDIFFLQFPRVVNTTSS